MRFFIKGYVDKISILDIINFGHDNGITVDKNDAKTLLFYLKNNWEDLLYGNPLPIIQKIENKLGKNKSEAIIALFYLYKDKYKDYL